MSNDGLSSDERDIARADAYRLIALHECGKLAADLCDGVVTATTVAQLAWAVQHYCPPGIPTIYPLLTAGVNDRTTPIGGLVIGMVEPEPVAEPVVEPVVDEISLYTDGVCKASDDDCTERANLQFTAMFEVGYHQ